MDFCACCLLGLTVLFGIGLYNFLKLTNDRRDNFLSFHCQYPEKKFYLSLFPLVIISYGFLYLINWFDTEEY